MPVEQRPIGSFPKTEASPDPKWKEKSLEELQEFIDWPHKLEEALAGASEPPSLASEPLDIPEPGPESVEETEAPESEKEPETVQAKEPETETVDLDAEILKAKLEALEAHNKMMEAKLSGREAGERGYIKQLQAKIKQLEDARLSNSEDDDSRSYEEPEPRKPRSMQQSSPTEAIGAWAVRNAVNQAASGFAARHPDMQELNDEIGGYIQNSGYNPESVLLSNDPIAAEREVTRVLEEAYWHVKAARRQSHIAELEKKRADQFRVLEDAKKKAATSGSGGTPPAPPPRKALSDLSLSELEKKMNALGRR